MLGAFHTLVYPVGAGADRTGLAFPAMLAGSVRHYLVDVTAFAADAGTTLSSAAVEIDPSLTGGGVTQTATSVSFTVAGGDPSVPAPTIGMVLVFADGQVEQVTIVQPVGPMVLPAGVVTLGGQVVTAGFQPVEIGAMSPLPGGPAGSDLLLLVRPGSPATAGVVSWAALPSGGGSGAGQEIAFVQAQPSATWTITHGLGRHPDPRVVTSAGDLVDCAVNYVDSNSLVLTFGAAFAGTAYL